MSKHKMKRFKDTLGSQTDAKPLFINFDEDELKQFEDECKYLDVYPGDEIVYRTIEKSDLSKRYPLDLRKDFIEVEKIWWDTEKQLRQILTQKDATPEAREFAVKGLELCNLLHPLWIEIGARRRKSGDTSNFWEMKLTENQFA